MGGDQPPLLTEGMDYLKWKREVGIWELGTSIAAAKQAAVCVLRIQDFKARDFATRLDVTELKKAEGLTYLMAELDKYFEEDNTQSIFLGIDDLEKFVRPEQMQMAEYIAEFKRRLNRIGELFNDKKEIYHDGMLAYRLLTQANLTKDQQILIKAAMGTQKLTSKSIEECLKRCFGDAVFCRRPRMELDTVKIKVEPGSDVNYHRGQFDEKDTDISGDNGEYTFYQGYNNRSRGGRRPFSRGGYNNYSNGRAKPGNYTKPWRPWKPDNSSDYKDELNAISHKTGDVARCSICDSNKHFRADCQHNPKKKDSNSVMYQSCRSSEESNKIDNDYSETVLLVNETFNKVLIDTGATSNVCGDVWLNTFLESMPEDLKKKVSEVKRNMSFRFGDGRAVESIKCVMLPVKLCNRDLMMETFVVPGELPFLFSRGCMKQLGVSLDIENDQIMIGGEPQQLKVTNSGHYVADIMLCDDTLLIAESENPKKAAVKLHRYFGHPSSNRLIDLVKETKYYNKELKAEIEKLSTECEHCVLYKRNTARPKASLTMAHDVNHVMAMDLKKLSTGHIMLHMIDVFSRFSMTRIIKNKHQSTVFTALADTWLHVFGRPAIVFSDNGGEFVNAELITACEEIGIE